MEKVLKYPLATEKMIRLIEAENKLCFVVEAKSTKKDIKTAIEKMFKAKVVDVNTHTTKGEKRAYIKLSKETPAMDIATNLRIM